MIEMKGADAYFLREESGGRHMHTLKIVVVDPATSHQALTFERVQRDDRISRTPFLNVQALFSQCSHPAALARDVPWESARQLPRAGVVIHIDPHGDFLPTPRCLGRGGSGR